MLCCAVIVNLRMSPHHSLRHSLLVSPPRTHRLTLAQSHRRYQPNCPLHRPVANLAGKHLTYLCRSAVDSIYSYETITDLNYTLTSDSDFAALSLAASLCLFLLLSVLYCDSKPSGLPTLLPTSRPSSHPSQQPSAVPSSHPSAKPSSLPSAQPSARPSR